jgi:hypothetical protein
MSDTLLQRTLDAAREFVTGKKKKPAKKGITRSYPVGYWKSDEPMKMARIVKPGSQEEGQQIKSSYDQAMGKGALEREVRAGRDPIIVGHGGHLPRADAKGGWSQGGFVNVLKDGAGNTVGPARTYATPATHWAPAKSMHREEYLASQYDFRKSRGELLPPFDEWLAAQGRGRKKAKIAR